MIKMKVFVCVAIILTVFQISECGSRRKFIPKHSTDCEHYLLCNKTSNYPTKYIEKLLEKKKNVYNDVFGPAIEPIRLDYGLTLRAPFKEEEERKFCDTKKVTVFPKTAIDSEDERRFIINIKGHEQSVTYEICAQKECFCGDALLNYKTHCKQLYTNIRLLYLTTNGDIKFGTFSVPSTCVCTYTRDVF